MKPHLLPLLTLVASPFCLADYVVDIDLGVLAEGATEISGTTAAVETDPGPPPVTIGGRNNASIFDGLGTSADGNWGNEIVYRFEIEENSLITLTPITTTGDPDFILLDSLTTAVHPPTGKNIATAVAAVFLDGSAPESFGVLPAGVYFLSVESWNGLDGEVIPGDSTFTVDINIEAARILGDIDLGEIAAPGEGFTLDTFGSDFDTELGLYDSTGDLVANNDDAGVLQSQLVFANGLPAGSYRLAAGSYDTFFGLGFGAVSGADGGILVLNHPGDTTPENVVFPGEQIQWFDFTIAGDPVPVDPPTEFIDLGSIAEPNAAFTLDTFGSSFDTELGVYNSNGVLLVDNDDAGGVFQSELIFDVGLPDGTYYAAAGSYDTFFNPSFAALSGDDGGDLVLNHPGSPTPENVVFAGGDPQWFRFTVGAGGGGPSVDGIVITSVTFDPVLQEFTVSWVSSSPGEFNVHMGTAAQMEEAASGNGVMPLVVSEVTSPVTVPVPVADQGADKYFLQISQ